MRKHFFLFSCHCRMWWQLLTAFLWVYKCGWFLKFMYRIQLILEEFFYCCCHAPHFGILFYFPRIKQTFLSFFLFTSNTNWMGYEGTRNLCGGMRYTDMCGFKFDTGCAEQDEEVQRITINVNLRRGSNEGFLLRQHSN